MRQSFAVDGATNRLASGATYDFADNITAWSSHVFRYDTADTWWHRPRYY